MASIKLISTIHVKSLWNFINSWSKISCGLDQPSKLPTLNRWFLDHLVEAPIKFPFPKEENLKKEIKYFLVIDARSRVVSRLCENYFGNALQVKSPRLFQGRLSSVKPLATSSSPRFDVYGNDFGWGKLVAVRSGGANKSDGTITMFCGEEEGSIDVEVFLSYDMLAAMGNDPQFINIF
ncbi:unnamed protein product [Vicia faba]|uniref:Uncharacterized protein n=1 Tax=Vicia faba TaxID=3906 RepID=A0AAV1ALB5_VICFA|nr:unnamed protein product [Vicia faba]